MHNVKGFLCVYYKLLVFFGMFRVAVEPRVSGAPPQHTMRHMNLQPLEAHNVDFSRVRLWNLNNNAKHYRQTLVFSAVQDPQINNLLSKHCFNYRGQVLWAKHVET